MPRFRLLIKNVLILPFFLTGCKLDQLLIEPGITPSQWCVMRPCVKFAGMIINEPFGSFLVFLLAALWIGAGFIFLASNRGQKSRLWLGIALVLGGIGAAQAGISYQMFSFILKCQGRQFCLLTNGFEVGYSLTQAVSVSAMLVSVAYACAGGYFRRVVIYYSFANVIFYFFVTIAGVTGPSRVLLSFEVLMLFALPGLLFVILISGARFIKTRNPLSGSLVKAALMQVLVQAAYFGYYASGLTQKLYNHGLGIYFSENDVLHVGMILWLIYVVHEVGKHLKDSERAVG